MRLIVLGLMLAVTGCAPANVSEMKASGLQTERFKSAKPPMEFVWCAMPTYDELFDLVSPASLRKTPTGFEVLKTVAGLTQQKILGMITVDADGEGSSVYGMATDIGFHGTSRIREVEEVIKQCL